MAAKFLVHFRQGNILSNKHYNNSILLSYKPTSAIKRDRIHYLLFTIFTVHYTQHLVFTIQLQYALQAIANCLGLTQNSLFVFHNTHLLLDSAGFLGQRRHNT